jgi:hypothetical protein
LEIVKPLTSTQVQSKINLSKPLPDTPPAELTPAAGKLLNSPTDAILTCSGKALIVANAA